MTSVHDLNYITVHGKYESYLGTPLSGSVSFTPSTVLLDLNADVIMMPVTFTATLDSAGFFSIDLPATDDPDITPTNWSYAVQENVPSGRRYNIQVPYTSSGGAISLLALAPESIAASPSFNYVFLTDYFSLVNRVALLESYAIDGGTPSSSYSGSVDVDGGTL